MPESMNTSPEKNLSLAPETTQESVQDEINKFQAQLKIFGKDPERNSDLIEEVTKKMNALQDARDAQYAVKKATPSNGPVMSNDKAAEVYGGQIFKRGNA
jgi:hypothetical protein